jgi:hypothetical protein
MKDFLKSRTESKLTSEYTSKDIIFYNKTVSSLILQIYNNNRIKMLRFLDKPNNPRKLCV